MDFPKGPLRLLSKLFLPLVAADIDVLEESKPLQRQFYIQFFLGASVFFASMFAFVSTSYAISFVFESKFICFLMGFIIASIILIIDALTVATYHSNSSEFLEFQMLSKVSRILFRLFLATLIGFSISIPLELKIFENEIKEFIEKQKGSEVDHIREDFDQRLAFQREQKFDQILGHQNFIINTLESEINGLLDTLRNLENLVESVLIEEVDTSGKSVKTFIKKYPDSYYSYKKTLKQKEELLRVERGKLNPLQREYENEIKNISIELDTLEQSRLQKASVFFSLPSSIKALFKLQEEDNHMWWTGFFLRLLIILLEVAPILLILLAGEGSYAFHLKKTEEEDIQRRKRRRK